MKPLPHLYEVELASDGPFAKLASGGRPSIRGGAPPEFDGDPSVWSPEQLLLASVGLCLLTTFRALAARSITQLNYQFNDRVEGILDKGPSGLRFSAITHHVEVVAAANDLDRIGEILSKAEKHCLIANSLNVPITLERKLRTA